MQSQNDSSLLPDPDPLALPHRHCIIWRLRNYFLAGIIVAAPMGITLYVTWAFISFVDNSIKPLIPDAYNPETYFRFSFPGLGLLIMLVLLTLLYTVPDLALLLTR